MMKDQHFENNRNHYKLKKIITFGKNYSMKNKQNRKHALEDEGDTNKYL